MKRIFACIFLAIGAITANADKWVKDAEPAILEVHYTRIEVYDTTMRTSRFFKDPVILRVGKDKSVFLGAKRLWKDSIMAVDPATFWEIDRARVMSDKRDDTQLLSGHYWNYIYKNIPDGKVTERAYFDMEHWQYTEDWEKPKWEILDESKEIIGYQCFKAVTDYRGRKWTAWFTPDIPIVAGPWKLGGLPGLILEAICDGGQYSFEATGIQQTDKPITSVYLADSYEKTDRIKFLKTKRSFTDNPLATINAQFGGEGIRIGSVKNADGTDTGGKLFVTRDIVDFIETDY